MPRFLQRHHFVTLFSPQRPTLHGARRASVLLCAILITAGIVGGIVGASAYHQGKRAGIDEGLRQSAAETFERFLEFSMSGEYKAATNQMTVLHAMASDGDPKIAEQAAEARRLLDLALDQLVAGVDDAGH